MISSKEAGTTAVLTVLFSTTCIQLTRNKYTRREEVRESLRKGPCVPPLHSLNQCTPTKVPGNTSYQVQVRVYDIRHQLEVLTAAWSTAVPEGSLQCTTRMESMTLLPSNRSQCSPGTSTNCIAQTLGALRWVRTWYHSMYIAHTHKPWLLASLRWGS